VSSILLLAGVFLISNFYILYKVNGGSMLPTYKDGDYLICRKVENDITEEKNTSLIGSAIVFRNGGSIMVKRVMAIDGYLDVIKGLCSNEKESKSVVVCYYIERKI